MIAGVLWGISNSIKFNDGERTKGVLDLTNFKARTLRAPRRRVMRAHVVGRANRERTPTCGGSGSVSPMGRFRPLRVVTLAA